MKKLILLYNRLPDFAKLFLSSLAIAIPFYASAIIGSYISDSQKLSNWNNFKLNAAIIVIGVGIAVFIKRVFNFYQESIKHEYEIEKTTLFQAYTYCDRIITNKEKFIKINEDKSLYQDILITNIETLQEIVNAAYQTFESTYGKSFVDNDRINFEVTFMTKSYLDGYITIPASANKDGRSPLSMNLRKTDPNIYENTVTASIYREPRPQAKIVEDTGNPTSAYSVLYAHQLDRIKSSIIYPVVSHANELLGTVVVHCDKVSFFKYDKIKYWTNLLEIFAKRLAFEKSKMDLLNDLCKVDNPSIDLKKVSF